MELLPLQWSSLGGSVATPPFSLVAVAWAMEILRIVARRLKVRGGGDIEDE